MPPGLIRRTHSETRLRPCCVVETFLWVRPRFIPPDHSGATDAQLRSFSPIPIWPDTPPPPHRRPDVSRLKQSRLPKVSSPYRWRPGRPRSIGISGVGLQLASFLPRARYPYAKTAQWARQTIQRGRGNHVQISISHRAAAVSHHVSRYSLHGVGSAAASCPCQMRRYAPCIRRTPRSPLAIAENRESAWNTDGEIR